ncbi:MAG: restriction endonuclease, partial [Candidatus Poribacteria bacterium]
GQREIDVEVRGVIDCKEHFVFIECKDWKRPIDIQEIDKLDSKRCDLSADAVMIYSNSGFTKRALRKAERVGIDAVSAIASGNQLIRAVIERELVAKKLSVDSWSVTLYPAPENEQNCPEPWDPRTLRYDGLPFVNWLTKLSKDLLRKYEEESKIVEIVALKRYTPFTLEDVPVILRGFRVEMICSRKWLSQTVREDVSLGMYDHIKRRLIVPNKQFWSIGVINEEAWEEMGIDGEPEVWTKPLEEDSFQLNLTLFNPIAGFKNEGIPLIDDLINERRTDFDSAEDLRQIRNERTGSL